MRFLYKLQLPVLIAIFAIITVNSIPSVTAQQSSSSNGLHQKGWNINLDGEWTFFEKELLTPNEVKEQLSKKQGKVVSIPSSFHKHTGDVNTFGTYSRLIKIPEQYRGETLAIHVPYQYSAYTLFVDDTVVAKNGVVGVDSASHVAEMAPKTGYFIAQSDEVLLTMQLSSFKHMRGGFENSIYLGKASIIAQKNNTTMFVTLFINGCIFIIGLFMFLFSMYRRKEHVFLIFGIFAILILFVLYLQSLFTTHFYSICLGCGGLV